MGLLKNNKKENNLVALKWIYRRSKRYLPMVALISLLSAFISASTIILALISKNVIDVATGESSGSLRVYGAALLGVIILQIILSGCNSLLKTFTNAKLTIALRNHLFVSLSRKKYAKITAYHSGDLLNRFTSDTDLIVSSVVNIIPNVVSTIAKVIAGVSALVILDYRIALLVLVFGVAIPGVGRIVNKKYKELHKKCQETEGQTRSFIQECFENLLVMKTFEGENAFSRKLKQFMKRNYRYKMKRSGISILTHLGMYSFFTVGYYALLLWGALGIAGGTVTYGMLTAFLQLVQQLRTPLQNISGIIPQYYSSIASAERLMEIEQGEEDKPPMEKDKLNDIKAQFKGLEFKNVSFSYDDDNVLENCSFKIEKEKITAITGESGSGKSTIFKIILGLFPALSGEITVNNSLPIDTSMRGLFAYVPQGNMVLSGTILENITLCDENVPFEKVVRACMAAEIYDLIKSLPEGFETVLTERGGGLSEGQIQRISIARALLTDAPVLLLDEATSALDEATETKVLRNIKNLSDKTVIFVTHRNTSLKVCDSIIHIEKKKTQTVK